MAEITITLPDIATWTKAVLVEAGIPPGAKYTSVRFLKGGTKIGQSTGMSDTLIARLMCIKRGGGVTDAKMNKVLSGYVSCTLVAMID